MSVLKQAHEDLQRRQWAADEQGDWQESAVLGPLVTVVDHTARIADHPDDHYRAEKAAVLLDGAITLLREARLAWAGWPQATVGELAILTAHERLSEVAETVSAVMWRATETERDGEPFALYRSQAQELAAAALAFSRWAGELAARAVPDPKEDW